MLHNFLKIYHLILEKTYFQFIHVHAVMVDGRGAVVHNSVSGHHPGPRPDIRHGGRVVHVAGRMRGDPDFDTSGPFVHQLIYADVEQFVGAKHTLREYDAVVELFPGAGKIFRIFSIFL